MFYQSSNSLRSDLLKVETGTDFSFPAHLHRGFELISVLDGEMEVTVDKKQYSLSQGKAVLVFPDQVHALHTPEHSSHILCIFSPQLVRAYGGVYRGKVPCDPVFSLENSYVARLLWLKTDQNELRVKGLLYSLCAEFDATAVYRKQQGSQDDLLRKIFRFVEEQYSGDCSLSALAEQTAYHSVYLSRYFKQATGLPFTEHVNRYRVNEAAYRLRNSSKKILDIAYECGFDSLRSFNRNFRNIMGMTPNEYRKQ